METIVKAFEIKEFRGINNVEDPARLPVEASRVYLVGGTNIEIDHSKMIKMRPGYGAAVYPGSTIHSLWSDDSTCLFVRGADLRLLKRNYSSTIIHSGAGYGRMQYVKIGEKIVYTNNSIIAYLDEDRAQQDFAEPTHSGSGDTADATFKAKMRPGHLLEYFGARLFVARDTELWYSDAAYWQRYDTRYAAKKFKSRLQMLRRVNDGLYISDSEFVWFMAGLNPQEATIIRKLPAAAIMGSDITVEGNRVGKGYEGLAVIFATSQGFYVGLDGGTVIPMTLGIYQPKVTAPAAAFIRERGCYMQYGISQEIGSDVTLTASKFSSTTSMTGTVTNA